MVNIHTGQTPGELKSQIMNQAKTWYKSAQSGNYEDLGKLVHMIQDTYCASHVTRDSNQKIMRFQDFYKQDIRKHHAEDIFGENRSKPKGYYEALRATNDILGMFTNNASVNKLTNYLDNNVLKLGEGVKAGGTEEKFK